MSVRKVRLYCAACCRRIWPLLTGKRLRKAINDIENNPERVFQSNRKGAIRAEIFELQFGTLSDNEDTRSEAERGQSNAIYEAALAAWHSLADESDEDSSVWDLSPSKSLDNVSKHASNAAEFAALMKDQSGPSAKLQAHAIQQRIKACVFGDFDNPMTLDLRWLSSTVLDIARTIYDQCTFETMPILGDALMDAGCDSDEIIKHCQGPGPHVRGCWVVDLILGKE